MANMHNKFENKREAKLATEDFLGFETNDKNKHKESEESKSWYFVPPLWDSLGFWRIYSDSYGIQFFVGLWDLSVFRTFLDLKHFCC